MDSFLSQEQCDDVPYIPSYQDWAEYYAWVDSVESQNGPDGQSNDYTECQGYMGDDDRVPSGGLENFNSQW